MLTVKSKTPSYKTVRKISKECPYCKSELTETERDFFPCTCSFQACVECYKDLMRNKKVCPSCHTQLKLERINALHTSKREELSKDIDSHQPKKSDKKSTTTITVVTTVSTKSTTRNDQTSVSVHHHEEVSRAGLSKMSFTELAKLRVIQKNMVYVIGLAPQIAKMDVLEKFEYFGQYGKVTKIIVNKSNVYNAQGPGGPSYSAYITFSNEVEASTAILAVDECMMYERIIRASYGTTKYCTFFLRDKACPNPACLYLHSAAKEKDCFVKDDNFSNKDIFNDQQRLALEHIQKHYQDILKKIIANKGKSLLPSLKTVEEKVQEFIEENERIKASTKVVEVEKIQEKRTEAPKSKPAPENSEPKSATTKVEPEPVERKQSDIISQEKEEIQENEVKPAVNEETKLAKEQVNITSPPNEKEEPTPAKGEAKNEPNCQSHRSFSSTQSTTINSCSKKEALVDQKDDSDSRPSVKSPDSLQKEVECNIKQDDIVMEDQANPEEVKSYINLGGLFDKIDPKEIAAENGTQQSEFNRKILDHLIRNLSSHSNSRFSIAQCEDKEDSDEGKTVETNVEDWDSKNEEFSFISKSIQEYLLSPSSSPPVGLNVQTDKFGQTIVSEDSSAFGSSHYSIENYPTFSTPTKKPVSNGNSNSKYVEQESTDQDSAATPTYSLQQELFDKGKNMENGMIYKTGKESGENQSKNNRRTNKAKGNKRQNKSGAKVSDSPNGSSSEVNGFYKGIHFGNGSPLLNDNQISGSYFGNIGINGAEGFAISNNTAYSRVSSTL